MTDADQHKNSNGLKDQRQQTKDEMLDKLLWFKILSSSLIGLLFGVLNFTGFFVLVLYYDPKN
jgi:hypothetical protein